jgi:hypothetical protein|nr:MAG TPA: stabilization protein [Caudoviricetes sp.]
MASGDLISRIYHSFRGVDFRGEEINAVRSPDSINMWKEYGEIESIRTRPGLKKIESFTEPVWGIFFYTVGNTELILIHSGTKLYKIEGEERSEVYSGLNPRPSQSFIYNNIWYFKDGINYLRYDGDTINEVEGYIPTTSIGRRPSGGGTIHEDVNMLTGLRINTFLADGESKDFYLDSKGIDADYAPIVKINGNKVTSYTMDPFEGKITFKEAPEVPLTDGQDNVSVQFRKTIEGYRGRINNCTLLQVFDNRVFFSGNKDYPNTVWHSSLDNPAYCSDLDYYEEGLDLAPVKALVAGNNALWVFKEPSQANTAVFYHNPVVDAEYGKIYPSSHSSISTGCIGTGINFNDDILFTSERGIEGISGDITTQQVVGHRSTVVDRKLLNEEVYKDMMMEVWKGYLLVITGTHIYLADSRGTFQNETHIEYEWFYWELSEKVISVRIKDEVLYLGTANGIYTLDNLKADVESYWTTPIDKFDHPQYQKTSNKRGCVAEATGDITVYVKTDKSSWEKIDEYKNVTDYFVSRIKRKKFKNIQLKFYSDTRFSLESVTIECYIGGYIKR